jgi:kynurenine formamidase
MRQVTRYIHWIVIGSAIILAAVSFHTQAAAQSWQPPADPQRCPSKWGPGDQRGSANHMKPETVLRAAKLIRKGEVVELGHVLTSSMPFFGTRRFDVHTKRTFMNPQSNRRGSNEEYVTGEIGQVGTQFDGFAHQTIGNSMYNCFKVDESATRNGFEKLGIENVGGLITRGVLIDVAGLKGVDILPDNYEITAQDIEQALERQKLKLQSGDAVILHTGWGKLWGKDNARYVKSCPGIGVAAAEWLAKQDPMLVGADNSSVEVSPNPDPKVSLPIHQIMLVVHGIHLLENIKLDELAAKRVHEFALIVQPLKIQGGTGSTVAPLAIH